MNGQQKKEYADRLKDGTKDFLDRIDTGDDLGQRIIRLIYGFARSGFLEYGAGKGSGGNV